MQNYKNQNGAIDKLPGDIAEISDEKVFFLSFATVRL